MFTIYHADCVGQAGNCLYPHKIDIIDQTTLEQAVSHDYVCAEYAGSYRNNANFLDSNCLPVDCDNDHSDDPEDWKYPSDVADAFPGVAFAVHYSRNNMKVKGGKAARPKFHVLFSIDPVKEAEEYSNMKKLVNSIFPYFDTQALDAARFFFGTARAPGCTKGSSSGCIPCSGNPRGSTSGSCLRANRLFCISTLYLVETPI